MEWFTILLWLGVGLISALYLFFQKKYSYWKDRGVTHLEPRIPYGNLPYGRTEHMRTVVARFYKKKDDGPFMGAYVFTKPIVIATDLDFVKDVLVKDFSNFHERGVYSNEKDDPLSGHMFAVDGQKWRFLRAKLSPTFTSGKIKFMFPTVVEVADRFNQTLSDIIRTEKVLEMKELLARFTTDIIGTCAFGIECNSLKDPDAEFRKYGRKVFDEPNLGVIWRGLTMQFPKLAKRLHVRLVRADVSDFFMSSVRETVEFREKNNIHRNDFMDLLIQLKNNDSIDSETNLTLGKLSFEDVAAQAFVFFIAGFETSSTTMNFGLYELALNPDIQEKARQEIDRVLAKHNGEITYESVMEMTYIDQIISETLRKYPPLVTLFRQAFQDYKVDKSDRIIEKGTTVVIPAYEIHHDPEIYPDPEVFNPDRFLPEQVKARHPMSFLGFGDGPRNCIGLRFGRLQSRVGLIMLLKNYRFKKCFKTPIPMVFSETNAVLAPVSGTHLEVEKI